MDLLDRLRAKIFCVEYRLAALQVDLHDEHITTFQNAALDIDNDPLALPAERARLRCAHEAARHRHHQ